MNLLIAHGGKVVAFLIAALCGWHIYGNLTRNQDEHADAVKLQGDVYRSITANPVYDYVPYSKEASEKESNNFERKVQQNIDRANAPLSSGLAFGKFYPRPRRPYVDPAQKPEEGIDLNKIKFATATMQPPREFSCSPEHGVIYVSFRLPTAQEFFGFYPVRVEIFRGTGEEEINELIAERVIGTEFDINQELIEQHIAETTPAVAPANTESKTTSWSRASVRENSEEAVLINADEIESQQVEIPAEYKSTIIVKDHKVLPKTTYYYKARIVGRLFTLGPNNLVKIGEQLVRLAPDKQLLEVAPRESNVRSKLFASAFTPVVSAQTPPNYLIRFAGSIGTPENVPLRPGEFGNYSGNFEVRHWVPEAGSWINFFLQVKAGDVVKAVKTYKDPKTNLRSRFEFDTGLILAEIQRKPQKVETERKVPMVRVVTREDGTQVTEPVTDDLGNQQFTVEKVVRDAPPLDVATLINPKTEEKFEFPKRDDFEKRKQNFLIYEQLARDQEQAERKRRERIKEILQKRVHSSPAQDTPSHTTPMSNQMGL